MDISQESRGVREALKHKTDFYRYAPKDDNGMPHATNIYYNNIPPTPCPDIQDNSVFDVEFDDVGLYDTREPMSSGPAHLLNRIYEPGGDVASVRPVKECPDYDLIKLWLQECEAQHKDCQPNRNTEKLKRITLIDAKNQRLVPYENGLKYLALSYVWGGVEIQRSTVASELPVCLPATIKHAMIVAVEIGVPYIWVDALCINQTDEEDKAEQIPLMDLIYEQSFATVIALGDSSNSGLPGVSNGPRRQSQLVVEFGPVKLISRCPTLSSLVKSSTWATRGWTFQEGLLSRRRIFFTDHQVYFHCNSVLCSENSPLVVEIYPEQYTTYDFGEFGIDKGYIQSNSLIPGRIRAVARDSQNGMRHFIDYLREYVRRRISFDEDAINAFGALLSRLRVDSFSGGFVQGIPRDGFIHVLQWTAIGAITKRTKGGFPSWTWAAWIFDGTIAFPQDMSHGVPVWFPLEIWLDKEKLYNSPITTHEYTGLGLRLQEFWSQYHDTEMRKGTSQKSIPYPRLSNALYIDGPVITLSCAYDIATQAIRFTPPTESSKIWPHGPGNIPVSNEGLEKREFLVIETMHVFAYKIYIYFRLMLLDWHNDIASRAGVFALGIEDHLDEFWELAQARRKCFWLV